MKSFLTLVLLIITLSTVWAQSETVEIKISNQAIDLHYHGLVRLAGGLPGIENNVIENKVRTVTTNTFSFGAPDNAVNVHVKKSNYPNVVGLYLTASATRKIKANEFQGLFFSSSPGYKEGVSFYRYKPWNSWTKPMKINSFNELEAWDNQCFYWQYQDGTLGIAVPLSADGYRTTLGSEQGSFGSKAVSYVDDYKTDSIPAMVIGFGNNLYTLLKEVYETTMYFTGAPENLAQKKIFPEPLEYIGWCTWNASAQGAQLNEETVVKGVASFTKNNFPLGWVLLDDGWFDHKNSQLRSLQPDLKKFPHGFSPLVKKLKTEFHIKYVGVWHAFNGYWNGIDPNSSLGERYKNELFSWKQKERVDNDDSPITTYHFIKPTSDSLAAFYNALHAYLKKEGITFIKVDNQLSAERMSKGNYAIGQLAKTLHQTLNASAKKYFDNAMINCMDMTADAYMNFGSTPVARSVEDYFPYEKEETYNLQRGNAAAHVLQGVYNNLYFSQVVFPDLDMFQSHNPHGEFHALARALNNGPIYITDNVGEQNFDLLHKLILGNGRILRADQPLLPTHDCLFQVQDSKPFKAFSQSKGIGLLGVWNAADADVVSGNVSPSDLDHLKAGKFAMYESFSQQLTFGDYTTSIPVTLKRMGYQLYYVAPLKNGMAPFGLLDKYNAPATMERYDITKSTLTVVVKQGGKFGAALNRKPKKVLVDGKPQSNFSYNQGLFVIEILNGAACVKHEIRITI